MLFAYKLPILSTIPRSGTWFLRYAISYLCHLERGGRIDDRPTGKVFGEPRGPTFDYSRFKGGPLFRVRGTLPATHLFIGHTVCPGFDSIAGEVKWWSETKFHVRGYDLFHEGFDYRETPVDLARYDNAPLKVDVLERSAARGRAAPIALVYRNPLDQAASYFRYCLEHRNPSYNQLNGRPLADVDFRDYLLTAALHSYAKQFVSFQMLAKKYPHLVHFLPYERLMADPTAALGKLLDHLAGAPRPRPLLADAVWLARRDHMKEVEKGLGRSLDGTRKGLGSHMRPGRNSASVDERTRDDAFARLRDMGIETGLFEWSDTTRPAGPA